MRYLATVVAAALVAYPTFAQSSRADRAAAFERDHGSGWSYRWNQATETPRMIFGRGLRVSGRVSELAEARRLADLVLRDQRALLRLDPSQFRAETATKVRQLWVFVYSQSFRGLPVIGGRADVRLHETGVVSMFGSVAVAIPADFDVRPVITPRFASSLARDQLGLDVDDPELPELPGAARPRLVIWADTSGAAPARPRLAFEVRVVEPANDRIGRSYVDAFNGAVIEYLDERLECNHTVLEPARPHALRRPREVAPLESATPAPRLNLFGNVKARLTLGGDPRGPTTNVDLRRARVRVQGDPGVYHTDADGNFDIPHSGTTPVNVTVNLADGQHVAAVINASGPPLSQTLSVTPGTRAQFQLGVRNPSEFDRAQLDAFYHTDAVNEWVRSVLVPNPPQLDSLDGMQVTVNLGGTACNAFYGALTTNFFRSGRAFGLTCNNSAFSDIIYHEWGHGLDDMFGGMKSNSVPEGLSEAYGDICSVYLTDRPVQGLGFGAGIERSAVNSMQYPANSCGSPQCAGLTLVGFAWQVREGLAQSRPRDQAIAISESLLLGSAVADPSTQPEAVMEVFLLDDDDGDMRNGTPHYAELETAANRHSLPFPARDPAAIHHTPLADSTDPLSPRLVRATASVFRSTLNRVELHYAANDSRGTVNGARTMMTSVAGDLVALLPGVLDRGTMDYHFEIKLDSGASVREPKSGSYSYTVNQPTPLVIEYEYDPAQVSVGQSTAMSIRGVPDVAVGMFFGNTPGPTVIGAIPPVHVGGTIIAFTIVLDGQGQAQATITTPNDPALIGKILFTQLLSFDANANIVVSNPSILLFQQ